MSRKSLSIIIPARNEEWLSRTVEDICEHIEGDTEVIAVLDGAWAEPPVKVHPKVKVLFFPESVGQRAATNYGARLSKARYIMKCDAHCAFDQGFDVKMMNLMEDDITMVPVMRNLHIFNWLCPDGHTRYQGPSGPCAECGKPTVKDVVWIPKVSPQSTAYRIDNTGHFQYWNELGKAQKGDLTETMSLQGSCFMLTRKKYWDLDICGEDFGSWGQQGAEVALKTWLSGGRVLVNRTTWYSHCFRTQGADFGFPYPISGRQVERARRHFRDVFFKNKWKKQIYPLSWLLKKFWPIPQWTEDDLAEMRKFDSAFPSFHNELHGVLGVAGSIPGAVANHTPPVPVDGGRIGVPVPAMGLSGVSSCGTVPKENVLCVGDESKMPGIAAGPIVANMIQNGNVLTLTSGDGMSEPSIHKPMGSVKGLVNSDLAVTGRLNSNPNPASANRIDSNLSVDSFDCACTDVGNGKKVVGGLHYPSKGIIYYTNNKLNMALAKKVRSNIAASGLPIVSATLKPTKFGKNIVVEGESGYKTMWKQVLVALEATSTDIIYFTEHDVYYHPSHFKFTPTDPNTFYYNGNYWVVRLKDGHAISYDLSPLSGLVAFRDQLITHFRERIEMIERKGFGYWMGFEPMTHRRVKWKNWYNFEVFMSEYPNIDIAHDGNLTKKRWSQDKFIRKPKFWKESTIDAIPGWPNLRELLMR